MNKGYVLFVIINDAKRFKLVKSKLREMNYNRFTVIDSYGATDVVDDIELTKMVSNTMNGQSNKKYNKTLYLVVQTEKEVKEIMDNLEAVQNLDYLKPGKGIIFTVPLYMSNGVRFEP